MKGTSQVLLLWAATLGLAFFLGWQKGKDAKDPSVTGLLPGGNGLQSDLSNQKNRFGDLSRTRSRTVYHNAPSHQIDAGYDSSRSDVGFSKGTSLVDQMKQPDAVRRMIAFTDALANLDESGLPGVIEAYEALPRGIQRYSELRMLMHAWARFDPEGAIEYTQELGRDESRFARMVAVSSWAIQDPDGAIEWSKERIGQSKYNPYMAGIIGGVVQVDLNRATDLLFEMPYGRERGRALDLVISKAIQQGGARSLIQWANNFPGERDPRLTNGTYGYVGHELSRNDIDLAKQWALGLGEGEPKRRAVAEVAKQISEKETPLEAVDWLSQMPEEDQYAALPGVISRWASGEPAEAGEWLKKLPASEQIDGAVEAYVKAIRHENPDSALEWANSITDDKRRDSMVKYLERAQHERDQRQRRREGGNP